MDSDTRSARVERLDVVETGRRRRWSEDEKLRIVLESLQGPRLISATAWRHGISRSLLLQWRRLFRVESKGATEQQTGFMPAMVVAETTSVPAVPPGLAAGDGAIEIEFSGGARMRITGSVDAVVLKAAVAALAGERPR
jgi:transposase